MRQQKARGRPLSDTLRIEDYALIGDLHTAALVGRNGSIDWLCLPRFDSGACFAALLGTIENGRWKLAPRNPESTSSRRYIDETLILETTFEEAGGSVTVIDLMPIANDPERVDLLRIVRGNRGSVEMEMDLALRFEYGAFVPWVRRTGFGLTAVAGPDAVELVTPVELRGENFRTRASFTVRQGEEVPFFLTWHPSHRPAPGHPEPSALFAATASWWRDWSSRCGLAGPYRERALRSLMVLKALTYEPTGGIVAAPTTSLPEEMGGVRNWDYRYCWLRDATFTLYALLISGYEAEAREWERWLLRAIAGKPSDLQIMYGIGGERRLPELELPWLEGYGASRPVRVGNAAHGQFQLDVYGEVLDCFHVAQRHGVPITDNANRVRSEILAFVETAWRNPDEGLWEVRGPRRRFTHSAVMAWVAIDRGIKAIERGGMEGPLDRWRALRAEIHDEVCARGFDPARNSFVQSFGGNEIDAALLMLPLVGFLPATDPRILGTIEAVQRELMAEGLVLRYTAAGGVDGLPGRDAPFIACTFWLADALAMSGRRGEAEAVFERAAGLANDVGLLSEEYDPVARRMLGNFPQAFSHVGLVNSVHNLARPVGGPAHQRAHA